MELEETIAGAQALALYELLRQRLVKEIPVAAPAAGAEWNTAVPSGTAWELLSVRDQLVTSAVVANRVATLRARDADGAELWRIPPVAVQAAGATVRRSYLPAFGYSTAVEHETLGLPAGPQFLAAGWQVGSITAAIDVGDAYTGVLLVVREWGSTAVRTALDWLDDHYR